MSLAPIFFSVLLAASSFAGARAGPIFGLGGLFEDLSKRSGYEAPSAGTNAGSTDPGSVAASANQDSTQSAGDEGPYAQPGGLPKGIIALIVFVCLLFFLTVVLSMVALFRGWRRTRAATSASTGNEPAARKHSTTGIPSFLSVKEKEYRKDRFNGYGYSEKALEAGAYSPDRFSPDRYSPDRDEPVPPYAQDPFRDPVPGYGFGSYGFDNEKVPSPNYDGRRTSIPIIKEPPRSFQSRRTG